MRARRPVFTRSTVAWAAAALVGSLAATPASAATCTWNPVAGTWNTAASWSCGFVPANLDLAVIAAGKAVTVTGAQPTTSVSNAGTVTIDNNSSLGLAGNNTNNGVITMQSVGNLTDLTINGVVSLNGTGSVQMSNNFQNRIYGNGSTLTLGAGQSILGSGQIGVGGSMALVNNGTVSATQSTALVINTTAGVTNNNVLRADGGTLVLQNTVFNQGASGRLDAINGSVVQLSGASVTGGSFTTAGGGAIATAAGTTSNLSGVTNSGTLDIVNNSFLQLDGNLTNNGTVNMQSVGNFTDIIINGDRTVGGTGVINLSNNAQNRLYGAGGTLTLGSGQTLQGAGQIGAGVAGFGFVNQGTVIATQSTPLLISAPAGVTNTGTLRADGGTLQLQSTINSGGGNIEARNGSQVQLLNGAVINNANFSVTGAGSLITTVGGAQVTLGGGTVSGPMTMANNSFVRQTGDLVYNGTLNMESVGNFTDLQIDGLRTISGAATISMSNNAQNRLLAANGLGDKLTLASGVILQGAGQLGANTALAVVNNGSVVATQATPLLIQTSAGITNNGVLRADGGTLQFANVVVESAGGTIEALNGSQVQLLNGTVINNANLAASGGGLITTVGGATVTLGGGTVSGPMSMVNNSFVRLAADMTYNGVLSMGSVGNFTDLQFDGARTLGGTATISMSNNIQNRLMAATGAGDSATFGSNITVQGAGQIGAGGALTVVNNGSWIANSSAGMVLSTTGAATNNALIRGDGASFTIANTQLNQGASGVLNAINGGSIVLGNGSQVNGGTFSTASGGEVVVVGGNTARVAGVNNTGTVNVNNNAFLELRGTLTNNGSVNLQSVGNFTDLRADGSRSILGNGTITLSDNAQNRIYGVAAGDSLVLGAGQTLQGAGQIGAGTDFNFTNNGTMLGNVSNALVFSSTGTVLNNGLVRSDGGNVVVTGGTTFGQAVNGALSAINGGVVTINGNAVISGGILATSGTGQFTTSGGNTATLANLSNTGTFNVVNNSDLRLQGTVNNTGTLNMGSVGNTTDLVISGLVNLAGNGITDLSNAAQNRIVALAPGAQITVGAGQTVRGSGQFGASTDLALVNQGTITANQSNALTMAMSGPVSNAAGGLMQAVAGGTLNINSALANAGTLAANGGVVNANAAFTGTGTALINGAGQLNVGAASSVGALTHNGSAANGLTLGANNITVSGDYTNANFGSGNTFNRRANVTGAGQILAGGNAAQAITGAAVSNGNTNNATLTIGNLRVGANTFNYQVANTGTTGPTLRGAIQTAANGGNITDARLSGAGVTAANYNAGAPGGNSGNLGVTFTAASAGVLAPLAGQVLNLRSNFDNIADQKLNIVLAGGAAAYNAAVGNAAPAPITVANQRVGGSNTAALTISNQAAVGAFSEDLIASFGSNGGQAQNNGGNVSGLLAGASNGSAMRVGVDTATAGAKTGTVTINYQTAGAVNGVSNGLGVAGANSPQQIGVNGNVYQAAAGQLVSTPLNFGTVQVGQVVTQNLVVRNSASGATGFVEDLNASFGAASGASASLISGTGSFSGIAAGQTSATSGTGNMLVSVNTGSAGAVSGAIAVNYFTAGAVGGVSNGLGTAGVGSDSFGVQGQIQATANVVNQASPLINNPVINLGAVRVGAASPTGTVSVSNVATVAPQAALNASIAPTTGPVSASGSFNGLNPGATNNASLVVGLNTGTAGNYTGANAGTATVSFVSDASNVGNCGANCALNLASQTVSVAGKVYAVAAGQLGTNTVDFGIVRVGDSVSASSVIVQNTAAVAGLNDTLHASVSGLAGPFAAGSVAGVAAQASGQVGVTLDTSSAGVFSQNGLVGFLSQNADMADVQAGADAAISVKAQVNNLANAVFDLAAGQGSLSHTGSTFYLDYGNVVEGNTLASTLSLINQVAGSADDLDGSFDLSGAGAFSLAGWAAFNGLAAGDLLSGLGLNYFASTLGSFEQQIVLNGFSVNASDPNGIAQTINLVLRGRVVGANAVPEPGSLALVLLAGALGLQARRRRAA